MVLRLREKHPDIPLHDFADAVRVPLGTLEDWLRPGRQPRGPVAAPDPAPASVEATDARVQTIVHAFRDWCGDFGAFCDHVKSHLHIDYGRKLIASILFAHGARNPQRRGRKHSDEEATRGSFVTFFPGAQWVADGLQVTVTVNEQRYDFNLELSVDTDSGAFVGMSIRDEEDSEALVGALTDGISTTKAPPIALLVDNRDSNHTSQVDEALGDTIKIRATLGRGQNKAHAEGAFGLFEQKAPSLELSADSPREVAREVLRIASLVFFRLMNHRTRKNGKTRVQNYREARPTADEIAAARKSLNERRRKQERARETRAARADPVLRALLDEAFVRLGIEDSTGGLRKAISCYSRDAVVDGLATFEAKRNAGTIPPDADPGRYLLGIVKNIESVHEADAIMVELIQRRQDAHDRAMLELEDAHRTFVRDITGGPSALVPALARRAMDSDGSLDRLFWLGKTAEAIRSQPKERWEELATSASRRIHTAFRVHNHDRRRASRFLLRLLWPVQ